MHRCPACLPLPADFDDEDCYAAAEVGFDGSLEELQALVASLAMAVAFSKSIAGCMPTITQVPACLLACLHACR